MNRPAIRAVRVDHYPNGKMLPLGITYENDTTDYIGTIHSYTTEIEDNGSITHNFKCESSNTKMVIHLVYKHGKWYLMGRHERVLPGQIRTDEPKSAD